MEKHIVIIGGGFGGLNVAKGLKDAPVRITLIDRRNHHLFQPLLYQVATGALSPADIASPLRALLKEQKNTRVLLGEVIDVDVANRKVIMTDGVLAYDTLVVATGARHHYFGNEEWQQYAPGLKTIEDATEIRRRILTAFEAAERATDPDEIRAWLTFVVVGGGPTGVELAGALAEIAFATLKHDFRNINPADARIMLVQSGDRILPPYAPDLSAKAAASLERLGVTVRTGMRVTNVEPKGVTLANDGQTEFVSTRTVLWAAGVQASSLGRVLAKATGVELDRSGRVMVEADLSLPGHPDIFVIGDLASFTHQTGQPLPGVAQVALQEGRYVARLIKARLRNDSLPAFRYRDLGNLATIGRAAAVADLGRLRFSGYLAWVIWLVVHWLYLANFENRLLVLLQWAWNYVTWNRSALLITSRDQRATTGTFSLNALTVDRS